MEFIDYYKILELSKTATEKENEAPRGKPTGYLRTVSADLNILFHTRLLCPDPLYTF